MEYLLGLALLVVIGLTLCSSLRTMRLARDAAVGKTKVERTLIAQHLKLVATLVLVVMAAVVLALMIGGG